MKEEKNFSDIPLEKLAELALKKAVSKTIEDHRRTGDHLVIWRDGKVVKVHPDQLEVNDPPAEYELKKE